ncbi:MAG TPA: hypothetical protein VKQ72_07660 [Aggregatilineales bacterium]|nr:hypothetical protein [Aggregatilineales bacterium]
MTAYFMDRIIEIEARFSSVEGGGRQQPPDLKAGTYRPHLCVPPQRTLLGIEFVDGPLKIQANVPFRATVRTLYAAVDYSPLDVGVYFDIVEGSKIVGHGTVIRSI